MAVAMLATACGGDDGGDLLDDTQTGDDTADDAADGAGDDTAGDDADDSGDDAMASGAQSTLEGVEDAVVRIVAEGTFEVPGEGTVYNAAGSGSGFIIDPSGIVVTNNHVVTGAAFVRVYFAGDDDDPVNARILGASECADLAVIDLEGDGYPYLNWYEDEINVGLDIYAAGFPLGDPEFTLTNGIVSKAKADGESSWASVDAVIEHDATINPGNSGGPLVTDDARVVGVNYAGTASTSQWYAISREEAFEVLDRLETGEDVLSIGINGEAFVGSDFSGVWVYSVEAGSPADDVGILPGDIVTRLAGLVLGTDGTMADYCDILRSRPTDVLAIEVYRPSTGEILEGRLRAEPLEPTFSFESELDDQVAGDPSDTYGDYMQVTDDTGAVQVDVPSAWSDVDGTPVERGPSVWAAPDLQGFIETWDVPGVILEAYGEFGPQDIDALLDENAPSGACTSQGRTEYSDPVYTGKWEFWTDCGGTDTALVLVAATPDDGSFLVYVLVQVVSDADLEALDTIIDTFLVVGDV